VDEKEAVTIENEHLAKVYQKFPVVVTKGKGALVWDINGKEYVDCMGGYGVCIVGHCHPKVVQAIKQQSDILITCHGSLYNDARSELVKELVNISPSGLDSCFLCNSGAESVEAAFKCARKYTGKHEILAMTGSFHGKTMAALSATWNPKYRKPFEPLLPDFEFARFGDIEEVKSKATEKTAAIIVEPIQGESGIYLPPDGFLKGLREICDEKGILLIFDEIQSGLARTGKLWASQHWDVTPDIMCIAKGMAGGMPMGAMIARREITDPLKPGDHTSTFGGNPLACAAACATIDIILGEDLAKRAEVLGQRFKRKLQDLKEKYKIVKEVRGLGLMIGMELRFDIYNILMGAISEGVILTYSGKNIVRFLPPLVTDETHLDRVVQVLDGLLQKEEKNRMSQ